MQEVGSYLSSGQRPMNEEHGGRKARESRMYFVWC